MSLKRICIRKEKLKCPKIPHCPKIPVMTLFFNLDLSLKCYICDLKHVLSSTHYKITSVPNMNFLHKKHKQLELKTIKK